MTNLQRAAILTAMKRAIDIELEAVREDIDEAIFTAYGSEGVEKLAVTIGGEKVAEFGLSFTKPSLTITDEGALNEVLIDQSMADYTLEVKPDAFTDSERIELCRKYPHAVYWVTKRRAGWETLFERKGDEVLFKPTGELVEYVGYSHRVPKCSAMRVPDWELVLRKVLPGGISGLLEAEND